MGGLEKIIGKKINAPYILLRGIYLPNGQACLKEYLFLTFHLCWQFHKL
jgi:hypothetical protein